VVVGKIFRFLGAELCKMDYLWMEPREELGILDDYISSSYVQCSECISKLSRQSPHPQCKPLGLVFW